MDNIYLILAGTTKELNNFYSRIKIPSFCRVPYILLFLSDDNTELKNWRYSAEIIEANSETQLDFDEYSFDFIIDLGNRLGEYKELNNKRISLIAKYDELFYKVMSLFNNLDYCKKILEIITENATEGIQIADAAGNYIYCNEASYKICGVTHEEREGQNVFVVQKDGAIARVLNTNAPVYAYVNSPRPGGKNILTNSAPIYNDKKQLTGAISLFNDVENANRIESAIEKNQEIIRKLNRQSELLIDAKYDFDDLIGNSECFKSVIRQATMAAYLDQPVLITGETGVGKHLLAGGIHRKSNRVNQPFIKVDCSSIPSYMLESELFGFDKDPLDNNNIGKPGKIELANNGTLLLLNIEYIEPQLQSKLLRVIQDHTIQRINGYKNREINTRIITTTTADLLSLVNKGLFRKDLFYSLDTLRIEIPPLKERKEDIPLIFNHLIKKMSHGDCEKIHRDIYDCLISYNWPGNIKEMENIVLKIFVYQDKKEITVEDIKNALKKAEIRSDLLCPEKTLEEIEKDAITDSLKRHGFSLDGKRSTAKALGISLSSLYDRIKKFDIEENQ